MEKIYRFAVIFYICAIFTSSLSTDEVPVEDSDFQNSTDATNGTQDLYIIKTVVYEIGILTEAGNDTEDLSTHEAVEVSIFDPIHNDTVIDLNNIPLPIQTNVSGVTITGLLRSNLGTLPIPEDGSIALFPEKQVAIRHNISTQNPDSQIELISRLSEVLGLPKIKDDRKSIETNLP